MCARYLLNNNFERYAKLYSQDINNNIENKVFYNNEYKPAVMPSQNKQSIKKEYIYIAIALSTEFNKSLNSINNNANSIKTEFTNFSKNTQNEITDVANTIKKNIIKNT